MGSVTLFFYLFSLTVGFHGAMFMTLMSVICKRLKPKPIIMRDPTAPISVVTASPNKGAMDADNNDKAAS